jgi:aspartate/methionine/tyrosine aminotransferase
MPHDGAVGLSARLPWQAPENALAAHVHDRRLQGDLHDLTETNPTRVGLPYPTDALRAAIARADLAGYEPTPLGLPAARAAVAAEYASAGARVDPARVVLTASSSESCAFLFKLLCDPGDAVLVPEPSYPLFDYLVRLEGAAPIVYRLTFDGVWSIDFASIEQALREARGRGARARAIVLASPNNPTGSFAKRDELARLAEIAAAADLAIIADEVFAPYAAAPDPARVSPVALEPVATDAARVFTLGGLSKSCGLPHMKLGWIVVGGPRVAETLAGLELVADTYLSVGGIVQQALPELLAAGANIRAAIAARVATNRGALVRALDAAPGCTLLPAEAGWSAIVRVPAVRSDEAWATGLVREAGVLVHPGYFFDLRGGTFLVVSLLPEPARFAEAVRRMAAHLGT